MDSLPERHHLTRDTCEGRLLRTSNPSLDCKEVIIAHTLSIQEAKTFCIRAAAAAAACVAERSCEIARLGDQLAVRRA